MTPFPSSLSRPCLLYWFFPLLFAATTVRAQTYADNLTQTLDQMIPTMSAPKYFALKSDVESEYDLSDDYRVLRNKRYLPLLNARTGVKAQPGKGTPRAAIMPKKPVEMPSPGITNHLAERVFNGKLAGIRKDMSDQELMGEGPYRILAQRYHLDPYYCWLYLIYVGLANKYYKNDQLHPTTQLRIDKQTTVYPRGGAMPFTLKPEEGKPFWIDTTLEPMYKEMFNQATITSAMLAISGYYMEEVTALAKEMDAFFKSHSAHSPEITQLLDNMMRYYKGEKSIQEEFDAVESKTINTDRFFPPAFYDGFSPYNWQQVPGEIIRPDWAGRTVSRKDLAQMALQRLSEQAAGRGIPETEVTKAMFEGRFDPYPDDLQLAQEALSAKDWNLRFGSPGSLPPVKTIIHKTEVVRSGKDLLLRAEMRLTSADEFRREFGFAPRADLTYDQALQEAKNVGATPGR